MRIVGLVKPKQLASRLGHTVANPASRTTNMSLGSQQFVVVGRS